jgi:hypothetical protein
METRFLETFVAVAEKGSFAEAARRLDLTPAAIAQRIRVPVRQDCKPDRSRRGDPGPDQTPSQTSPRSWINRN